MSASCSLCYPNCSRPSRRCRFSNVVFSLQTAEPHFRTTSCSRPYVPLVCDVLLNATHASPAAAVAAVMREFQGPYCLSIDYDGFIATESAIELNSMAATAGVRATLYQMCTQLGWWQTSDSDLQPFGSLYPLAFFEEICQTLFGVSARESLAGSARLNVEHGGLRPVVRNVLFTSGADDPGRMMSVLEYLNDDATAVTIPGEQAMCQFIVHTCLYVNFRCFQMLDGLTISIRWSTLIRRLCIRSSGILSP